MRRREAEVAIVTWLRAAWDSSSKDGAPGPTESALFASGVVPAHELDGALNRLLDMGLVRTDGDEGNLTIHLGESHNA